MDIVVQILVSGLTIGAMYAIATIGLSLIFGAMGMLNMAHGAMLTIGGYACYFAVSFLGLPIPLAAIVALLAGGLVGLLVYHLVVRQMLKSAQFETNIIIVTVGVGALLESLLIKLFGAQAKPQPAKIEGVFSLGNVVVPWQNVLILASALVMMALVALLLKRTAAGRAIRATSMNRDAAQLMGVRVGKVYAQVLALSGALAAISGIMISSIASLSPSMGADPMLKAFIICVVAGLGNVFGSIVAAIGLGLFEAAAQYVLGVRFGFASLLLLVIVVLIWRPEGLFGRRQVVRL